MAKFLNGNSEWPPELATFDPRDWGPVPGAVLQACRCAPCTARWGAALPPDDSTTVGAARRRWREARIAFLRETLGRDHPAYKLEVFEAIVRMSRPYAG
jgi:hypothetical protein